jgi:Flp pilus assembly protein TadD
MRKTMVNAVRRWMILASMALALAGCSHEPPAEDVARPTTTSVPQPERAASPAMLLRSAEEARNKGEPIAALSLLAEAHRRYPEDAPIASAYGRLALALGHGELAAPLLEQAIAADPADWRALSAKGVLESRQGRFPDGRRALILASKVSASEAVILNNLAVSHLLDGKPGAAISLIRQGLAAPDLRASHERRLKRNLALAMAMEGRLDEAEKLAGEKLPRELASGDMAVLRRLIGVNQAGLGGGAGWQAQIAEVSRPARPALQ